MKLERAVVIRRTASLVLIALVLAILVWTLLSLHIPAADWENTYYPAIQALIKLQNPYQEAPKFIAPAWTVVALFPFAFLPEDISRVVFFIGSLLGFAYVGYKMGCRPIGLAAFLLSAPVAHCLIMGNVEWLPLLGLCLPAPLALVFLTMKPQTTIGAIIYLLVQQGRLGFKTLAKAVAPAAILFGLSTWAYGLWFTRFGGAAVLAGELAIRIWPYGVVIGLVLLFIGLRKRQRELALAASPWLSPYTILLTWSGFIVSFAKSTKAMVVVSALSWLLWLAYRYR